jgi:AAA+ superfamily predicted ATPase
VATVRGAGISLACLARNGADLSKPMPSKHTVFAADDQAAAQLRAWAQANGFAVRDFEILRDQIGRPQYRFDLVRVEVPVPEKIEQEARLILSAVQQIPGTYYQTWCGGIVR